MHGILNWSAILLLTASIALGIWLLNDELRTQHLRRAALEDITFPETAPNDASADRLDALATRALETTPMQFDLAKHASDLSISKDPRRTSNWNRLAFIDIATDGTLSEAGLKALEESFYRSPYGEDYDMKWRLEFTNAYWTQIPDDMKIQSLSQITALSQLRNGKRWLTEFKEKAHPEIAQRIDRTLGL